MEKGERWKEGRERARDKQETYKDEFNGLITQTNIACSIPYDKHTALSSEKCSVVKKRFIIALNLWNSHSLHKQLSS